MKKLQVLLAASVLFVSGQAYAVIRPIIIPGKMATIMLQAVSASGGGDIDPEPRELFDAIAMAATASGGGEGKVIGTPEKDFNLSCAYKSVVTPLNVLCTIVTKPSPRTRIAFDHVQFDADGPVALEFFEKFAGPDATEPFVWKSKNGWVTIESTPEKFTFRFER